MITSLKSVPKIPQNINKINFPFSPLLYSSCNIFRNLCSKSENDGKHSNIESTLKEKNEEDDTVKKSEAKLQSVASNKTKEEAKQKLFSLLSEIKVSSDEPSKIKSSLNLAKAVKRITKKEQMEMAKAEQKTPEEEMNLAVKAVASTFKEDSAKVESELTEKLTHLNVVEKTPTETEKTSELIDEEMNHNLMSSVEKVADTITESPIPPRSELTKRLLRLSLQEKVSPEQKESVISLIKSMKVKSEPLSLKKALHAEKPRPIKSSTPSRVHLFEGTPLNIFSENVETKEESRNLLWEKLEERELRCLTQFAPANAFEEMIMWTEQGKHWKFPIDNETEMGEEENVGFHEHVFLERHLKGFPTKGPIRHFMELVCVGLSRNPYITVERKIENIEWFRNYFKEKEAILKDTGAI